MSRRRKSGVMRSLQGLVAGLLASLLATAAQGQESWREQDIRASRQVLREATMAQAPVYQADPLGLMLVVETGDSHITILDGDKFEPLHRFATGRSCMAVRHSPATVATHSSCPAMAG